MAREATIEEKEILRLPGQASILFSAFRIPNVVYSALLNGIPASNDMVAEIDFDTGVGTLANVKQDMTLWVGSSAGKSDLGICRIRKTPIAGKFYIGEQSKVVWVNDCHLTVIDDFDAWARHIFMDGSTVKMDYDIEFDDQHTNFLPVPVLGPVVRVAQLVESSVVVPVGPEQGYQSYVYGSTISTYLWSCATATAISSTSAIRPTMTFDSTGWHTIYCTVTAANGKSKQGVRYIYIWSKEDLPHRVFRLEGFEEDFQEGGIRFGLEVAANMDIETIPERALCVVFAVDYYGYLDEQQEISIGAVEGAENIIGIGRLGDEVLTFDTEVATVGFQVNGYQQLLKKINGFPSGVEMKNTPLAWTDMPALTVDRGMWHLLEWRTTATRIMDVIPSGNTLYTKEVSSPATNLWSQLEEVAFSQILANVRVDHLARLFVEYEPLLLPEADRDYPVVMELEKQDVVGQFKLPKRIDNVVGQINLSGLSVTLGATAQAHFGLSPGHDPDRMGGTEIVDRLLLEDQPKSRQLAALIFAARNNPYAGATAKLNANNRLITCTPNQALTFHVDAADNPRGYDVDLNWIPRRRRLSYDIETMFLETDLELDGETVEGASSDGDVPGSGSFTFPPSTSPSYPPIVSIPVGLPGAGGGMDSDDAPPRVLTNDRGFSSFGLFYTENFHQEHPDWYSVNGGLLTYQYQHINRAVICPNGSIYVGYCGDALDDQVFIARAPYIGGAFEIIEDRASLLAKYSPHTGSIKLVTFACNPLASEEVAYVIYPFTVSDTIYDIYFGAGTDFSMVQTVTGVYDSSASLSYGLGQWVLSGGWGHKLLSADLSATIASNPIGPITLNMHNRLSTTGKIFYMVDDFDTIAISENNTAGSITNGIGNNYHGLLRSIHDDSRFAIDPTGQLIMCMHSTTSKGKSYDGGYTLLDNDFLPISSPWVFAFAGGTRKFIAASSYMRYTSDFGESAWADKLGNLPTLAPLFVASLVKVVGAFE